MAGETKIRATTGAKEKAGDLGGECSKGLLITTLLVPAERPVFILLGPGGLARWV